MTPLTSDLIISRTYNDSLCVPIYGRVKDDLRAPWEMAGDDSSGRVTRIEAPVIGQRGITLGPEGEGEFGVNGGPCGCRGIDITANTVQADRAARDTGCPRWDTLEGSGITVP